MAQAYCLIFIAYSLLNNENFQDIQYEGSHGTKIRWLFRKRCASKKQSVLFDLFKALDKIESSNDLDFFP